MSDLHPDLSTMDERAIVERIVEKFRREAYEVTLVLPEGGTTQLLIVHADDIREIAQHIVYGDYRGEDTE